MRRLMEPMAILDQVRNFVFVVIDHRRAHDFASIVDGFETLLDERLGFVAAEIRSATPLTAAQHAILEAQVSEACGAASLDFRRAIPHAGGRSAVARVKSTGLPTAENTGARFKTSYGQSWELGELLKKIFHVKVTYGSHSGR